MASRFLIVALLTLGCSLLRSAATAQSSAEKGPPLVDNYGDPLPEHALLRIGTVRLRTGGQASQLVFTADGQRLVTMSYDTGCQVWDVTTGKLLLEFARHVVARGAISADGKLVAAAPPLQPFKIFETGTGKVVHTIEGLDNSFCMCISPDAKLLASIHPRSKLIRLTDVVTGKMVQQCELDGNSEIVRVETQYRPLVFSADSRLIAFASESGSIWIWDVRTGGLLRKLTGGKTHLNPAHTTFSPDGKRIAAINIYKSVNVWEIGTGNCLIEQETKSWCVGFTPDVKCYITHGHDKEIQFLDIATGKIMRTLAGRHGEVAHVAFSADGKRFAAICGRSLVNIWDLDTGKPLHEFGGHMSLGVRARYTTDGSAIVSIAGSWDEEGNTFKFWDPANGKLLRHTNTGKKEMVRGLSGDGRWLAMQASDSFFVRDLATGKDLKNVNMPNGNVAGNSAVKMTADGRFLVSEGVKSNDGSITRSTTQFRSSFHLCDVASGKIMVTIDENSDKISGASFTDDGRHFAVLFAKYGKTDKDASSLVCWDTRSGRKTVRPHASLPDGHIGTFSPTGRCMAWHSYTNDECIQIRELATGKLIRTLRDKAKNSRLIHETAFSPDGRTIAVGTTNGDILLWSIFQDEPIARLSGHRGHVGSVGFSPNGKSLVSGGVGDVAILVWDVARWTGAALGQTLTNQEADALWRQLLDQDSAEAYAAIGRLEKSPAEAVALLKRQIKPTSSAPMKEIAALIADLDSPTFAVRQEAMAKLGRHGIGALCALEKCLDNNPPLEVRSRVEQLLAKLQDQPLSADLLRAFRALELLEMLATPDAMELLQVLANGEASAWLTQEAAMALARTRIRFKA
jgi:WD40 repeat protein